LAYIGKQGITIHWSNAMLVCITSLAFQTVLYFLHLREVN